MMTVIYGMLDISGILVLCDDYSLLFLILRAVKRFLSHNIKITCRLMLMSL